MHLDLGSIVSALFRNWSSVCSRFLFRSNSPLKALSRLVLLSSVHPGCESGRGICCSVRDCLRITDSVSLLNLILTPYPSRSLTTQLATLLVERVFSSIVGLHVALCICRDAVRSHKPSVRGYGHIIWHLDSGSDEGESKPMLDPSPPLHTRQKAHGPAGHDRRA